VVGLIKEKCVAEILSGLNAGQEFADVSSDFVFVHGHRLKSPGRQQASIIALVASSVLSAARLQQV
jgi:hypothetical protein